MYRAAARNRHEEGGGLRHGPSCEPYRAILGDTTEHSYHPHVTRRASSYPQELAEIATRTLTKYEKHAQECRAGTQHHEVSQNIAALLRHLEGDPPFTILDFGCGPGRDLSSFSALGHVAIGLEGAASLAAMARSDSGCQVWEQDFLQLDLPAAYFDGIFANASLFHVPTQALPRVLRQLHTALRPDGVLFCSNPHGDDQCRFCLVTGPARQRRLPRGHAATPRGHGGGDGYSDQCGFRRRLRDGQCRRGGERPARGRYGRCGPVHRRFER